MELNRERHVSRDAARRLILIVYRSHPPFAKSLTPAMAATKRGNPTERARKKSNIQPVMWDATFPPQLPSSSPDPIQAGAAVEKSSKLSFNYHVLLHQYSANLQLYTLFYCSSLFRVLRITLTPPPVSGASRNQFRHPDGIAFNLGSRKRTRRRRRRSRTGFDRQGENSHSWSAIVRWWWRGASRGEVARRVTKGNIFYFLLWSPVESGH